MNGDFVERFYFALTDLVLHEITKQTEIYSGKSIDFGQLRPVEDSISSATAGHVYHQQFPLIPLREAIQ